MHLLDCAPRRADEPAPFVGEVKRAPCIKRAPCARPTFTMVAVNGYCGTLLQVLVILLCQSALSADIPINRRMQADELTRRAEWNAGNRPAECAPNPCQNSGLCSVGTVQYKRTAQCQCARGFSGKHCEICDDCEVERCEMTTVEEMLSACCGDSEVPHDKGTPHRRSLQHGNGCSTWPDTCAPDCAIKFASIYESAACKPLIKSLKNRDVWQDFYTRCSDNRTIAETHPSADPQCWEDYSLLSDASHSTANGNAKPNSFPTQPSLTPTLHYPIAP